jgi:EAL and modified HD-GYP domain-containing signal transduction protein
LRLDAGEGDPATAWHGLFDAPDLLAAIAPLDCVLLIPSAAILTPALLELMPPNRVIFAVAAAALADPAECRRLAALQEEGYRILVDGVAPAGVNIPPTLRAVSLDCAEAPAGVRGSLPALYGPHLARGVHTAAMLERCASAGFGWFSGDYPMHPGPCVDPDAAGSRRRLLSLLGLVAADASTQELEALLKQDAALSYHLMKLANSAAFARGTPVTSFGQAIGVMGRRQLQRWLQLLLYARQGVDGLPNPLLAVAALRAAQMESLCKQGGAGRDAQDIAFMVGVFSLLDVLLDIPMSDIVTALKLAPDVAGALLARSGPLGRMLALVEMPAPTLADLQQADVAPSRWWQSQLQAFHWAIQVSRNV